MANGDFVQQKTAGGTGASVTVTLDSTPTVGNTLICRVACRDSTNGSPKVAGFKPVDFTIAGGGGSTGACGGVWYRQVVSGDGTSIVVTPGATGLGTAVHVEEVVGVYKPHRSVLTQGNTTTVTSRSTGTSAATTTAAALCCAMVGIRNVNSTGHSWSNSYTLLTVQTAGSGTGSGVTVVSGDLVVAATGTQEATASWTTAERAWGVLAVFVIGAERDGAYITAVKADTPYSLYRMRADAVGITPDEMNHAHLRNSATGLTYLQTGPVTLEPDNYCYAFNGTAGFCDTKSSATSDADTVVAYTGDVTFEVWAKTSNPSQGSGPAKCVFVSGLAIVDGTFAFPVLSSPPDGVLGDWYLHHPLSGQPDQFIHLWTAPTDTWEIFWVTLTAAGIKIYRIVSGVVTQYGSAETTVSTGYTDNHRFGRAQGANYLSASIANGAVWRSALTTTQMQAHYDASITVATTHGGLLTTGVG